MCLTNNSALKKVLLMISSSHWLPDISNLIFSRDGPTGTKVASDTQKSASSCLRGEVAARKNLQLHHTARVSNFCLCERSGLAFALLLNNNTKMPSSPTSALKAFKE